MTRPSYQLTRHPLGSIREIWGVSWPLIFAIFSTSLMFFADRLFLAHYSVEAMTALAVGGLWSYFLLVLPFNICEITEVFVGKYNGSGQKEKAASPVWQMLYMILLMAPLILLVTRIICRTLFGENAQESIYLTTFMAFSPFHMAEVALSAFFIGIGRVKIVTVTVILANILNVILAPLFIFSMDLGIKGAAYAAGLSFVFLTAILFYYFLKKENRIAFATNAYSFDFSLCKEMLRVALPSGLGRCIEMFAHCMFFRIIALAGKEALTACAFVQSFYILTMFVIDGVAKGTTAVISNFIGAMQHSLIPKALKSALLLHSLISALVAFCTYEAVELVLRLTLSPQDFPLLDNSLFITSLKTAVLWMGLFFLFDGFTWIIAGFLTAKSDTKFIMFVSLIANWLTYLLPVYILITFFHAGSAESWMVIALNQAVLFLIYAMRARSHLRAITYA